MIEKQCLMVTRRRPGKTIKTTLQMTDYSCQRLGFPDEVRRETLYRIAMTFGLFLSNPEAKEIRGITIDFVTFDEATNA